MMDEGRTPRSTLRQTLWSASEPPRRAAPPLIAPPVAPQASAEALEERIGVLAGHMARQWQEHEQAQQNANRLFDRLLTELSLLCGCFQRSLGPNAIPQHRIDTCMDADRSVGILHLLWHTVSFTARGNTRPLAMYRHGRDPVFTGRIVALLGDFNELSRPDPFQEFSELLTHEIASLYVPADTHTPAMMSIRHLGDEEHYFEQPQAARLFLLKIVEMLCVGGYFHEKEYY